MIMAESVAFDNIQQLTEMAEDLVDLFSRRRLRERPRMM